MIDKVRYICICYEENELLTQTYIILADDKTNSL